MCSLDPEEDAFFWVTYKENGGIHCEGVFEQIAAQIKAHSGQNFNTTELFGRIEQYPICVPLDESESNDTSGESESGDRTVDHQKPAMSAKGQS